MGAAHRQLLVGRCLTGQLPHRSHLAPPCPGGCEGTDDGVVAAVARHCGQLTMLDLSESQRVTAGGVQQVAALQHMLDLSLGWNIRLQDAALAALPPSLTKLDLRWADRSTPGSCSALLAGESRLAFASRTAHAWEGPRLRGGPVARLGCGLKVGPPSLCAAASVAS